MSIATAPVPSAPTGRLRRGVTASVRGARTAVVVSVVVAGSLLRTAGYLTTAGIRALDAPRSA